MARTLWLLRHGDAEPAGPRGDSERHLTARGEREAQAAGRALARLRIPFEHVYSSPRRRALDTALIACAELGVTPRVHEPLAGGFGERDASELLAATSPGAALLLVGHEPDLSQLIATLTGAHVEMRKGGIAAIAGGTLLVLLRPREIELVAGL